MRNIKIAVDFDGTCVLHKFPNIGEDVPHCVRVLHRFVKDDVLIILNTMRSGEKLNEAVEWFIERKIPLYGVNGDPDQIEWTTSPKVYANMYVDDAAVGYPTKVVRSERSFENKEVKQDFTVVDWIKVEELVYSSKLMLQSFREVE